MTEDEEKKDARYNIHDDEIVSHPVENVKKGAVDDTSAKHEQTSPGITLNVSNNSTGGSVNNSNFARNQGAGFGAGYNAHDNAQVGHIGETHETYSTGNQDAMYSMLEKIMDGLSEREGPASKEHDIESQGYTGMHDERRGLPEHKVKGLIAEKAADSGHTTEHYDDTVSKKEKDDTGNGGAGGKDKKRHFTVSKGGFPAVPDGENDTGYEGKNTDTVPRRNRSGGDTGKHLALEGRVVELGPSEWEELESYVGKNEETALTGREGHKMLTEGGDGKQYVPESGERGALTGREKHKMLTEGGDGKQYVPESGEHGALTGRGKQYELESGEHAVAGFLPEETATGQAKEALKKMYNVLESKGYAQITSLLWTRGKITLDDISDKNASGIGEMCIKRTIEDMTQDSKKYNTSVTKNLYNAARNIAESEQSGSARQAAEKLENACVVQTAKNALKEGYRPRPSGSGKHPTKRMDGKGGKNEELKRDIGDDMYNSVAGVLDLVKDKAGYTKVVELQRAVGKEGYKSRDKEAVKDVNEVIKQYQPFVDGLKTLDPKGELIRDLKPGVKKAYEAITAFRADIGKGYLAKKSK